MSRHYIKYPIAYDTKLKSLINIKDVHQENKGNLVCKDCNDNFVAVLNHKTPHFKHKPNSKCTGNVESYLHWITKECFDLISEIELPEIFIEDLESLIRRDLKESIDELIKSQVPKHLQREFERDLKKTISASKTFNIQSHKIEKTYKTELGDVRIDVVAIINNQELFIEPFFMSPIDYDKRRKLERLNIPTLAINLVPFIQRFNHQYTIQDLVEFLKSKVGKVWIYNRENKITQYISAYLEYVEAEIDKKQEAFKQHHLKIKKLNDLHLEVEELEKKIRPTEIKIYKLNKQIGKLKDELGIPHYDF